MANFLKKLKTSELKYRIDEKTRPVTEANPSQRKPENIKIGSVVPKTSNSTSEVEESDVDLSQISKAYYSDSYISRAINKIVGLMFKEGWHFTSRNSEALSYVEKRFKLMEESTQIRTNELLRELGLNYVLFANAIVVKTRGTENTAKMKYKGFYSNKPISGLFPVNPQFINIERDDKGNVTNYIVTANNEELTFPVEDVLHMTYQKPTGMAYGVPYITNTIRDVLVLRQIEETVTNILYRNLHPLQVYTVGLPEPGFEAKNGEIEQIEAKIADSRLDSMFIVPERHKIEAVKNDYLDASAYLKYFRQRIFTGLGVSESTMGIGDTANRSTSDNQSSDLIDLVKDFQQNFTNQFQKIINEILFEGGYDPTLNYEDVVKFDFVEIEQSSKISRENHEIQKWLSNLQSLEETRLNIGYEPTVDLDRFYMSLVKKDTTIDNSQTVANKDMPENQNGKKTAPKENKSINIAEKEVKEPHNLTNNENKVILQTGNHEINKEIFASAWNETINAMQEDKDFSKENFIYNFNYFLGNDLFKKETSKNSFVKLITESIQKNGQIDCNDNNFYQFEEHLFASYNEYCKILRKEIKF